MDRKHLSVLVILSVAGALLLMIKSSALLMYWQQSRHWFLGVDSQHLPFSSSPQIREWNQLKNTWSTATTEAQQRLLLASRVLIEGNLALQRPSASKPCPVIKVPDAELKCPVPVKPDNTKTDAAKRKALNTSTQSSLMVASSSAASLASGAASSTAALDTQPADEIMQQRLPIPVEMGEKILLIGDSMMQGVAPHLVSALQRKYGIEAVDMGAKSTGLTYPGFFNWPAQVDEAFTKNQYKILVVLLGANDTWDMLQNGRYIKFASPVWRENYVQRIEHIIQSAEAQGTKVIWLSPPPMGREDLVKRMPLLYDIMEAAVAKFPNSARFVSTAETLTQDGKTFTKFLEVPEKGSVMIRKDDGVHFTPYGENLLAKLVLSQLKLTPLKPAATSASK